MRIGGEDVGSLGGEPLEVVDKAGPPGCFFTKCFYMGTVGAGVGRRFVLNSTQAMHCLTSSLHCTSACR